VFTRADVEHLQSLSPPARGLIRDALAGHVRLLDKEITLDEHESALPRWTPGERYEMCEQIRAAQTLADVLR
jgi:hypothetical protein